MSPHSWVILAVSTILMNFTVWVPVGSDLFWVDLYLQNFVTLVLRLTTSFPSWVDLFLHLTITLVLWLTITFPFWVNLYLQMTITLMLRCYQ